MYLLYLQLTETLENNLHIFRTEFLNAKSWNEKKDGAPLYLLDELSPADLKIAEQELIKVLSLYNDWSIIGLGHIKSKEALPLLYNLLKNSRGTIKVIIAHSIFQISQDEGMKDIVLKCMPKIRHEFDLIKVLCYLPAFRDKRLTDLLHSYRNHKKYLVACNASRSLGLPINDIIEKFHNKQQQSFWRRLFG